ncbi:MAG: 50S ribosomal protein L4 [bacterium]|nr:50S ribosomal protein L4 [bacterium]
MEAPLYNQIGAEVGKIELPDAMFGADWNSALVKQVVDAERANRRRTVAHTKIRGEVRGGGKKPWKQKGTGRARHGSSRSPIWKGGGTTFGPRTERIFEKKINKKMKRGALFAVLSAKVREQEGLFLDALKLESPKTRYVAAMLNSFPQALGKSIAYISGGNKEIERSARNIANLEVLRANELNVLDLMQKKYIFIPKDALEVMKKTFLRNT